MSGDPGGVSDAFLHAQPHRLSPRARRTLLHTIMWHRRAGDRCACGWGQVGDSHAEHVVEVFEAELEELAVRTLREDS